MSLVSVSEMAALRATAESGMESTVTIYYRTVSRTEDGLQESFDATASLTVIGWLTEATSTSAMTGVLDGAVAISEVFQLHLPVGTVIHSGDKVVVSGAEYMVQHTNVENTYLPMITCSLRKVE